MRILVYGAGVLGSNLAHNLYRHKKDVTLLARGGRAKQLKENGLVIKHRFKCRTTRDRVRVIESLAADDVYDVIFVVVQYAQIESVLPALQANGSGTVVFIGNNMTARQTAAQLPGKTVLFGFTSVGGKRENGRVVSVSLGAKITLGSLDGGTSYRPVMEQVFAHTGYKVTYCDSMDDWLKTHGASILPIVYACYYAGGDLKNLRGNKTFFHWWMDADREAYDVLVRLGFKILPDGEYEFVSGNRRAAYLMFKLLTGTCIGNLAARDHAMSAVGEMRALAAAFDELAAQAGLPMPAYDRLRAYLPEEK